MGYVVNDVLVCSSLGQGEVGWNVGQVDWVSSRGFGMRNNVKFPFTPDTTFIIVEYKGYIAIINKNSPIDATTQERDVSLAAFSLDNQRIYTSRGKLDPTWLTDTNNKFENTFIKDGYVVAVAKSKKYRTAGLAALPVAYMNSHTSNLSTILVPLGIMAGLIFAGAIYYLVSVSISMSSMLKSALRHQQFFMLYQPVIDLQTGQYIGAEALMRWRRPNGEMVPPDKFIQAAEELGLMSKLTKRVVELISKDAANLFRTYPEFHLAINLSATDICTGQTIALLKDLIQDTGALKANLIVEATERGFMQADLAKLMLTDIRKHGISVALDDFGTGYSSLSYLESFEIDYLKIDKSFVDKIGTDAPTSHVVLHIIEMAKALNIKMIAEGVETEVQALFLKSHGVQYAQGWLFGKPMPLHEVIRGYIH